ncbi:MAG: hypothetical protein ACOZE5_12645 [Verrucomicrobiota bacterium]
MKKPRLLLVLTLCATPFAAGAEVAPGATFDEVRAVLGAPSGQVRAGGRHLVYYARGAVELVGGRVARVDLRSPEEHASLLAREERLRGESEARRARLIGEGAALRDRKLADASFQAAPAAYQVAFWEDFARRYPGVSCVEPLTIARARLNEQLEEKRRKDEEARRIAELEARLAAAERAPVVYHRVRPYRGYGHHDPHHEFALWPVNYTFYDAPLPVYTTPTTPAINPLRGDPAQPPRFEFGNTDRRRRGTDECGGPRDRRGADRGHGRWRDRM